MFKNVFAWQRSFACSPKPTDLSKIYWRYIHYWHITAKMLFGCLTSTVSFYHYALLNHRKIPLSANEDYDRVLVESEPNSNTSDAMGILSSSFSETYTFHFYTLSFSFPLKMDLQKSCKYKKYFPCIRWLAIHVTLWSGLYLKIFSRCL